MPPHKVIQILVVCSAIEFFERQDYFEEVQLDCFVEGNSLVEISVESFGDLFLGGR